MTKRLILNGFSMNAVSHVYHGFWRHPDTRQTDFNDLAPWVDLAKLLEKGCFDALFVADVLGTDPAYRGSWDTYIKEAVQIPINDSGALIAALIGATEHLGLTFTSSILQEHPFNFARKVSTLDHLSKGRIGWNIVTSVSHNAAQNFGFERIVPHDERYRWAEEYVDVVYKLWEGSWDDDAVIADKQRGLYADPDRIHRIRHVGERYRVLGPHLSQPSPQRTPVLFQAGSSHAGRAFAAQNAEGTFITSLTPEGAARLVTEVRGQVAAAGRDPGDLLFVQGLSFVIGSTEEEARRKARDLDEYRSDDGLLAHISRDLGIDLGLLPPDQPVDELDIEGVQGLVRFFEEANPGLRATVADIGQAYAYNTRIVGTPESIADELARWQAAGVDGINVIYQTTPGSFAEFIENVLPVLQQRGLAQRAYGPGTYRERLFAGSGARLNERHPAARYRGAFRPKAKVA
ncbi:LLM class flavin-dependent oxidoreductase [Chelatococcus reniformis]|uniref:Monooxygenase n=1 Tax=Chelatococcus reniformis TaxID=1494448 RepID=A0A916TXQ5_9HYPH|nr:LLM class flavin-dependent oxidoreductase [Chelatococcus reniformis]GGC45842.1 monooxygenase [Chelatococcus reniformis]